MYESNSEIGWLRGTAQLVLSLASTSKSYETLLFTRPLGKTQSRFSKMSVDGSWTQGVSTMQPRFAELATQQSQMGGGMVRATQVRQWDPTQTQHSQDDDASLWSSRTQNASLLTQTSSSSSFVSAARGGSGAQQKRKMLPPVPRFRKYNRDSRGQSRKQGSIFARRRETIRRQKAARKRRLQMERKSSVQIVRTYVMFECFVTLHYSLIIIVESYEILHQVPTWRASRYSNQVERCDRSTSCLVWIGCRCSCDYCRECVQTFIHDG